MEFNRPSKLFILQILNDLSICSLANVVLVFELSHVPLGHNSFPRSVSEILLFICLNYALGALVGELDLALFLEDDRVVMLDD